MKTHSMFSRTLAAHTRNRMDGFIVFILLLVFILSFAFARIDAVMTARIQERPLSNSTEYILHRPPMINGYSAPAYWEDGHRGPFINCDEDGEGKGCSPGNPLP